MATSNYTPGPWMLNGWDVVQVGCADTFPALAAIHDGNGALCMEEINANARLIAAAPELLAALKLCWEITEEADCLGIRPEFSVDQIRIIEAALTKAEGRGE